MTLSDLGNQPATLGKTSSRGDGLRRLLGALFLVFGVIWLWLTLAGAEVGISSGFVERTETRTHMLTGRIKRVTVVRGEIPLLPTRLAAAVAGTSGREVEVVPWDGPGVRVEVVKHGYGWTNGSARRALERMDVAIAHEEDTVRVVLPEQAVTLIGRLPSVELRIAVPVGVAADFSATR